MIDEISDEIILSILVHMKRIFSCRFYIHSHKFLESKGKSLRTTFAIAADHMRYERQGERSHSFTNLNVIYEFEVTNGGHVLNLLVGNSNFAVVLWTNWKQEGHTFTTKC